MRKTVIILTLLLAFLSVANAQTELKTFDILDEASLMNHEKSYEYAMEYALWLDKNSTICTTDNKNAQIATYAKKLENLLRNIPDINNYNLDIKALHKKELGITTYPNGSIRMSTDLMDNLSDDQILAIIACEIYRSTEKINFEKFRQIISQIGVIDKRSMLDSEIIFLTSEQLKELDQHYKNASLFNHQDLLAADSYGYELLVRIQKDPRLIASTLIAIDKLENNPTYHLDQSFPFLFGLEERLQKLDDKYTDYLNTQLVQ